MTVVFRWLDDTFDILWLAALVIFMFGFSLGMLTYAVFT
jgi:hypothetical protein